MWIDVACAGVWDLLAYDWTCIVAVPGIRLQPTLLRLLP
jgi:hypothetical protein